MERKETSEVDAFLAEDGKKERVFNSFLRSGLHGFVQGGCTILAHLYREKTGNPGSTILTRMFENVGGGGDHAEVIMIKKIERKIKSKQMQKDGKFVIQLFSVSGQNLDPLDTLSKNYSPCEGCVSELIEFKKSVGVDVKVKLNYAGLFNAHRVSCIERSEFNKTNKKRKHDYKPCTESTKELIINKKRKKKIYIRPFSSFEDWQKLSSAINDCQDLDEEGCPDVEYGQPQYEAEAKPGVPLSLHDQKCCRSEEDKLQLRDWNALPHLIWKEDEKCYFDKRPGPPTDVTSICDANSWCPNYKLRVTWEPCDSDWKGQPEYYIVEHRKCGGDLDEHKTSESITKAPIEINYAEDEHPDEVRVYAVNKSGRSEDSVISIVDKVDPFRSYSLFSTFLISGQHGASKIQDKERSYLVVMKCLQTSKVQCFKEDAEGAMIKSLRNTLKGNCGPITFNIYMTNSPTPTCVDQLIDLDNLYDADDDNKVKMVLNIKTASLYKVFRTSCDCERLDCSSGNLKENINYTYKLAQLMKQNEGRIKIGAFSLDDWISLAAIINKKEDLKIAYSELHYSAQYGRWNDGGICAIRSEEDQRQKDDYAALLNIE